MTITFRIYNIFKHSIKRNLHISHLEMATTKPHSKTNAKKQSIAKVELPKPSALVLIAPGTEELECITVVNVLRRGDVEVTLAGIRGKDPVKCRAETWIVPDCDIRKACTCGRYNAVIIPGGLAGAKLLSESEEVGKLLKHQEASDGVIAAICAAPTTLKAHGIAKGKKITSYPVMAEELRDDYKYIDNMDVVIDGNLITSKGPATAMAFAFAILERIRSKQVAEEVACAMLYKLNKYLKDWEPPRESS